MRCLIVAAVLAACVPAMGRQEDALRGPAVPERLVRTIVRHDARGNFKPVEGRPEAAAVGVLGLEGPELERARERVTQRAVDLNVFLIEHVDDVKELTEANQAGNKARSREVLKGLQQSFDGERGRDPLAGALELNEERSAELTRVLDEYWKTWLDWELRYSRDKSETARKAKQDELVFRLFQGEVQQAYDRTLKPYRDRIESLYAALEPTAEQRAAIREAVIEYIRTTRAAPTARQREEVLIKIYGILDEERRAKLFAIVARQLSTQ